MGCKDYRHQAAHASDTADYIVNHVIVHFSRLRYYSCICQHLVIRLKRAADSQMTSISKISGKHCSKKYVDFSIISDSLNTGYLPKYHLQIYPTIQSINVVKQDVQINSVTEQID
jgi:hypothetical protein